MIEKSEIEEGEKVKETVDFLKVMREEARCGAFQRPESFVRHMWGIVTPLARGHSNCSGLPFVDASKRAEAECLQVFVCYGKLNFP